MSIIEPPKSSDKIERARSIWQEADDDLAWTLAEEYLFRLGGKPPWPASLRYQEECWHGPSGTVLPALIGKISDVSGKLTGITRVYLSDEGGLADVEPPRLLLGSYAGNALHLGRPPPGELLIIAESLIAALRWHWKTGCAAWSPLSASGIARLVLPNVARDIMLVQQSDAGHRAASDVTQRWRAEGRNVRIVGGQ